MPVHIYHQHQTGPKQRKINLDENFELNITQCYGDEWQELSPEPYKIHGGRSLNYIISDGKDPIGAILLRNDTPNLKARDKFIGWEDRSRLRFILRSTCVSPDVSLVPLLALMSVSRPILNAWNSHYPDEHIVGVTTTSLSWNLVYWNYCGKNVRQVPVEMSPGLKDKADAWMKEKYPRADNIYKQLKLDRPKIRWERNVHFCELYKDTLPFLRNEMETIAAIPKFDNRLPSLFKEPWRNDSAMEVFYKD